MKNKVNARRSQPRNHVVDRTKPIGMVPQTIPPDAVPEEEEEYIPFTADPDDPNVQALAKLIGWDRVREMAEENKEAAEELKRGDW